MSSSLHPHSFIGINQDGDSCVVHTTGNKQVHVILRGGRSGPNYHSWDIVRVEEMLRQNGLPVDILVDCSHGNSKKDYRNQAVVLKNVVDQRVSGRTSIKGFMIESYLQQGRQELVHPVDKLTYGMSITDGCIGWDETKELLRETAHRLAAAK